MSSLMATWKHRALACSQSAMSPIRAHPCIATAIGSGTMAAREIGRRLDTGNKSDRVR